MLDRCRSADVRWCRSADVWWCRSVDMLTSRLRSASLCAGVANSAKARENSAHKLDISWLLHTCFAFWSWAIKLDHIQRSSKFFFFMVAHSSRTDSTEEGRRKLVSCFFMVAHSGTKQPMSFLYGFFPWKCQKKLDTQMSWIKHPMLFFIWIFPMKMSKKAWYPNVMN